MQKSPKSIAIVSGVAVIVLAASFFAYSEFRRGETAHASPAPELLSELPAGAPTLIYADLAAIRASTFYQQRADKGPIAVPDGEYSDFVNSTGFDFEKDLDRVVIASWPAGLNQGQQKEDHPLAIVLAEGRFDRQKIHDYALRKGKVDHQSGHEVFLFPQDKQTGGKLAGWNSLTFLDDHRVAIVQGPSVAPLFAHPDDSSAADPARERAARVAGAAVFLISRVPPIPDNASPGGAASAQFLNLARSVQWVTLAARPEGNDLRVSLEGECQTPMEARQLQAALELLRVFGQAGLGNPKTRQSMDPATLGVLDTLLKSADVSVSAERVRVMVELTPDILKLSGPKKTQ